MKQMKPWIRGAGLCVLLTVVAAKAQAPAAVAVAAPDPANLALNKPVTINGKTQATAFPEKAVDGLPTNESGWHSHDTPSWLQVDLLKVYPVDRVSVYQYHDGTRYYQYTVDASEDGKTWKTVVDMSTNKSPSTSGGNEHVFARTEARYVRVNMLKNSANPGEHLNELMVFEAGALPAINLQYDRNLRLGDGDVTLRFPDSHAQAWDLTRTLALQDWAEGKDHIAVGKDKAGLTSEQLARIGFVNPSNKAPGAYQAALRADGELEPGDPVVAVNPPFDVSPKARTERAKLYEVPGLESLTGKNSPLEDGLTIAFFGDSITWQNVYVGKIGQAIKAGEGTKDKQIKLINRGINGADAVGLRNGSSGNGYPGNTPQKPFAELLAADKVDLAVVFIGINDVWFGKAPPEVFEKALRDMVASAKANKTTVVLTTVTVHGELPDGRNGDDPKIEVFSEVARKVAKDTGVTLVDLRKAYIAYLQNNNGQLRVGGRLEFKPSGLLTYDGVHPTGTGNELLANLIADGIVRALKQE